MVKIPVALFGLVASAVHAHPILEKRIAQSIAASTAKWEQACLAAGGGQLCNPVSVASFSTLLANAGPCAQQDAADNMVDLSKQLKSTQMVNLAQTFAQQPRNSPNSLSIPYCQKAPRNPELDGLFQCQFEGVDKQVFVPNVQLGGPGTTPFGSNEPVSPLGSCPAHPDGPVPDGQQLADIAQNPTSGGAGAGAGGGKASPAPAPAPTPARSKPSPSPSPSPAASEPDPPAPAKQPAVPADRSADGRAAQQANAKFATLGADSSCNAGEVACVEGAFAQCVSGEFVTMPCGNGATCAAVPLNRGGTVVTCTTQADAISRIQATGASGGLTG